MNVDENVESWKFTGITSEYSGDMKIHRLLRNARKDDEIERNKKVINSVRCFQIMSTTPGYNK